MIASQNYDTSPIRYLLLSLCTQFVGVFITVAFSALSPPFALLFVCHSLVSGSLALFLGMSRPWLAFNFLLPGALFLSVTFPIPAYAWLLLFVVFAIVYLPTFWTKVPFFASEPAVLETLIPLLPSCPAFTFIDIGCGDAKLLAALARKYPQGTFLGYELSPLSFIFASVRSLYHKKRFRIFYRNFWNLDWSKADVVYCFLSPAVMQKVGEKFVAEMRKDSVLISNSFSIPQLDASQEAPMESARQPKLLVYRAAELSS